MKLKIASLISVCGILIFSCTAEKKTESAILPPFENLNVRNNTFDFDAEKGTTIQLANGTSIYVPEDALVDGSGNRVTGKVSLHYREFLDASQILMSGIPMRYDSAGRSSDFISAGMFEIGATQNGQALQIKSGKSVRVDMASPVVEEDFNFYSLDSTTGKWTYIGRTPVQENPVRKKMLDGMMAGVIKPVEPKQLNVSRAFKFDINLSEFPELKFFNNVQWEYAGSDEDAGSPAKNSWIFGEPWRDISAVTVKDKEGVYIIKLEASNRNFEMEVKPVFAAADLAEANARFSKEMELYEARLSKAEEEINRKGMIGQVLRSFELTSFGFCNWDRIQKMVEEEEFKVVEATYSTEEFLSETDAKIYLITNGGRSVRLCNADLRTNLIFDPEMENKLLAILPGNYVAVCGNKEFEKIGNAKSHDFHLTRIDEKITDPEQLKKIIENL
jgi:hypothetical protein